MADKLKLAMEFIWLYDFCDEDHQVWQNVLLLGLEFLVAKGLSAKLYSEYSVILLLWGLGLWIFGIWRVICYLFWFFEWLEVDALISLSRLINFIGLCIVKCAFFGGFFPSMVSGQTNSTFSSKLTLLIFLSWLPSLWIFRLRARTLSSLCARLHRQEKILSFLRILPPIW